MRVSPLLEQDALERARCAAIRSRAGCKARDMTATSA